MQYQVVGDRVICGCARFSALGQGLVRLEWSATSQFEDRPTVQAMTRPEAVPFQAIAGSEEGILRLQTELIEIHYRPDAQAFNDDNLQIQWRCGQQNGTWVPSTVDHQNLGGTFASLDLIHRNFRPSGVHPAAVEQTYPHTQEWLYGPMKQAHLTLRDRGETTRFEEPPLWYLARDRQVELPEEVQQFLQEWQHFPPGILSRSGYSVINDSASAPLENNWLGHRLDPKGRDWYFLAYGADYAQALQNFVRLCGSIPMLPRWAFGIWFSVFGQLYDSDYQNLVKQFEERDLPLDVLILDVDWHLSGWCGWDWNPEFFPDARSFLKQIHQQGLHVGANIHPEGVAPGDSQFQALCEARGLDPE
ncbi:MAG TPA: TIM-barrel domain-containing protein, partial [Candidatus Obscuribacterales bacterium]